METITDNAMGVLKYCERNNIKPPNLNRILESVSKSRTLIGKMY